MNRRGFLQMLGLGVAGIAIEQAIPFGRVWSFPSEIVVPQVSEVTIGQYADFVSFSHLSSVYYDKQITARLMSDLSFTNLLSEAA